MEKSNPNFTEKDVFLKLERIGQAHLVEHWGDLSWIEQKELILQIEKIDEKFFLHQREEIVSPRKRKDRLIPFHDFYFKGFPGDVERGRQLLSEGKCACLMVAGGQGSRLRFKGPKGCFPISVFKKKSFFQLFSERILAASKWVGYPLQAAIMTSPENHSEVQVYFDQNGFFKLNPSQIHFFIQDAWPLLDLQGNLFLQKTHKIAFGPSGNGNALRQLVLSGIWEKWKSMGIEMVNFVPVDNPLADPFDAEFFGFHDRMKNDVSLKVSKREHYQEQVGILVKIHGKIHVVEYTEFPEKEKLAKDGDDLRHSIANLSLFCFNLDWIKSIQKKHLPMHANKKSVKKWEKENVEFPNEPNCWKFEEYIFDVLPFAQTAEALVYPREECFAPLKNLTGIDSIGTVQDALLCSDRKAFWKVSGITPPEEAKFELAQSFYYPTDDLISRWRGKALPNQTYIEET